MSKAEPAVIGAAIAALLNGLAIFALGDELTEDQQGAIVVTVTVLAGLFVRSKVTPVA